MCFSKLSVGSLLRVEVLAHSKPDASGRTGARSLSPSDFLIEFLRVHP